MSTMEQALRKINLNRIKKNIDEIASMKGLYYQKKYEALTRLLYFIKMEVPNEMQLIHNQLKCCFETEIIHYEEIMEVLDAIGKIYDDLYIYYYNPQIVNNK